jgi:hypothetical protein
MNAARSRHPHRRGLPRWRRRRWPARTPRAGDRRRRPSGLPARGGVAGPPFDEIGSRPARARSCLPTSGPRPMPWTRTRRLCGCRRDLHRHAVRRPCSAGGWRPGRINAVGSAPTRASWTARRSRAHVLHRPARVVREGQATTSSLKGARSRTGIRRSSAKCSRHSARANVAGEITVFESLGLAVETSRPPISRPPGRGQGVGTTVDTIRSPRSRPPDRIAGAAVRPPLVRLRGPTSG